MTSWETFKFTPVDTVKIMDLIQDIKAGHENVEQHEISVHKKVSFDKRIELNFFLKKNGREDDEDALRTTLNVAIPSKLLKNMHSLFPAAVMLGMMAFYAQHHPLCQWF